MKLTNSAKIWHAPSPEIQRRVELRMAILDRIHELIDLHFHGKQKELAGALGVSEAAISKMINGYQNFELDTLIKLEIAFGESILAVVTRNLQKAEYLPCSTGNIALTMNVNPKGVLNNTGYEPAVAGLPDQRKMEETV